MELSSQVFIRKRELLVFRFQILAVRHDPNLQQVRRILRRRIKFAVHDPGSRCHMLQLSGTYHCAGAHAVAVLQRSIEYPGQDFHVPVRMHSKSFSRRPNIFIQHAQGSELDMLRIVILVERKRESRIQPGELVASSFFTRSNLYHFPSPSFFFLNGRDRFPNSLPRRAPACGKVGVTLPVLSPSGYSFLSRLLSHVAEVREKSACAPWELGES